jgi:hypothetical protein
MSNTNFVYSCGPKFELDIVIPLFSNALLNHGNLILVSGDTTYIYKCHYQDGHVSNFKLIHKIIGLLVKRQKKGGQSAIRFSRLAEESRLHYVSRIVDSLQKFCQTSKCLYAFGSRELTQDIITKCKTLKINVTTLDQWHSYGSNPVAFINEHVKELKELFLCKLKENDNEKVGEILGLVHRNPDYLKFGCDEIMEHIDQMEYIVGIDSKMLMQFPKQKCILCPMSSVHYATLKSFEVIGKLYYVL